MLTRSFNNKNKNKRRGDLSVRSTAKFTFRILAMAIAIGMFAVSCGDDDKGSGGSSVNFPAAKGHLTVTGLSAFDGKYIFVSGTTGDDMVFIIGCKSITDITDKSVTYHLVKIEGGSAKIPLFCTEDERDDHFRAYEGDDKNVEFYMAIVSTEAYKMGEGMGMPDAMNPNVKISFTKGDATIDWGGGTGFNGNTPPAKGHLTVEGLSAYNGMYAYADGSINSGAFNLYGTKDMTISLSGITFTLVKIENGSVRLPLYYIDEEAGIIAYDGNGTSDTFSIIVLQAESFDPVTDGALMGAAATAGRYKTFANITFANGDQTINWANGTPFGQ